MSGLAHGSVLVVSIASNRLAPPPEAVSIRDYLATLTWSLPSDGRPGGPNVLTEKILTAGRILLFDAAPESAFWPQRETCWQENIFIIDGRTLLSSVVLNSLRHPIRTMSTMRQARTERLESPSGGQKSAPAEGYASATLEEITQLLAGERKFDALFFNNNSFSTEILRTHLLENDDCNGIVEIMHGIGSVPLERFFDRVLAKAPPGRAERHVFVPQLPDVPTFGAFSRRLLEDGAPLVVNAYLQDYLTKHDRLKDIDTFVEEQCRVADLPVSSDAVVVTILGNNSLTRPYTDSAPFRAECFLISELSRLFDARKRNCVLLYVPHPTERSAIGTHAFFAEDDVKVCSHSVFTWLISDLSVSLMSSALFEARYFGSQAFTPSVASDGIFTQEYLDLISHPASPSREDLARSLEALVDRFPAEHPRSIEQKAKQRMMKIAATAP